MRVFETNKQKTKAIIALVFALVLSFALVGCATPSEQEETTEEPTQNSFVLEPAEDESEAESEDVETQTEQTNKADSNNSSVSSQSASKASSGTTGGSAKTESKSASQSSSEAPSAPAHTHDWVAQYKTVTVTDKAAWSEPIRGIACSCGQTFTDKSAAQAHIYSTGHASGSATLGYTEHPAVTHTEQQLTGYKCACGATKSN